MRFRKYALYLFSILALLSVVGIVISFFLKDQLPGPEAILPPLFSPPIQSDVKEKTPFVKTMDGIQYVISPQYEYEIQGLVVTYNNFDESWLTFKVHKDPLNIKDLCVIWGGNLNSKQYLNVEYHSGAYTCYVRPKEGGKIYPNQISNNHVLPANEDIAFLLKEARTGDQIAMKGYLVNYQTSKGSRKTSIVRTDTGNGACEVLYVTQMSILDAPNFLWRLAYKVAWILLTLSLLMLFYFYFVEPLFHGKNKIQ